MARKKKRTSLLSKTFNLLISLTLIIAILAGVVCLYFYCVEKGYIDPFFDTTEPDTQSSDSIGNVEFHFISIGQGDAALIRTPEGDIVIDSGRGRDEHLLKKYLDSCGVRVIKYAIFTHPHEDHIGGADTVLRNYTVEKVIMPDCTATTQAYKTMLKYIEAEGCEVYEAMTNDVYELGKFKMTVLSPDPEADYGSNYNNYSVVLKAEWGNTSAILTGDAEKEAEAYILSKFSSDFLKSDLLKVGHHGSHTSSTKEFLKAISPKVAVISCGAGNEYGHPHKPTINALNSLAIKIRRTDTEGNIVYCSNGTSITEK
jgi:competence protein ComEC